MIDTSLLALPKPGHAAGRVVETPAQYSRTKRTMWLDQGTACSNCGRGIASPAEAHRHHLKRRGMGGSKRDDRFTVLICEDCHHQEHP